MQMQTSKSLYEEQGAVGAPVSREKEWNGTAVLSCGWDGCRASRVRKTWILVREEPGQHRMAGWVCRCRPGRKELGSQVNPQALGGHSNIQNMKIIGAGDGAHEARVDNSKLSGGYMGIWGSLNYTIWFYDLNFPVSIFKTSSEFL